MEWAGWRWVLLVNVPLGIVAAIATKRMLVESRASGRRRMPDLRGALLLAVTLGLVTLGLVKGPDWGWLSVATVGSFLASVLTSVGFVHSSRSHPAPLVEPALLRSRSFVAGNLLTLVAAAGFYCYGLTHVLYLNYVWHYSLLKAGFAIAPAAVVAAVVAAALGRVAGRHGHRVIVLVGALVWAGSLVWYLQRVGSEPDFLRVWLPGQLLQGIGVGATLPVLSSAALAEVAKGGSYATSSAVVSTTRQLGAVLGVAVMVILIGKPEHGTAEEALRRGWAMAAICFIAVAVAAAVLGRTNRNPVQMPAPEPAIAPRSDDNRDRHLRAKQLFGTVLSPDPLRTPNNMRNDPFTDDNRDRHLRAKQLFGTVLSPDPLRTPNNMRNDRHPGLDRHSGRPRLEFLDLEAAADGRLGVHADEFAGLQHPDGGVVGRGPVLPIHRDVAQAAHNGTGDLVIEHLLLGHEPHLAPEALLVGGQTRKGEVEVAGVVDRDDGAAAGR